MAPQSTSSDCLQCGPDQAHDRLVLLHGWGADADDLLDLAAELVPATVSVVALRAPEPHPAGIGRQWYPLLWRDLLPEPAWEQVPAARQALAQRLRALAATVPLERTVVLGFSQGAAMAVDVATGVSEDPLPFAAVIGCSGYPHRGWQPRPEAPPVLLTHGTDDPVVPLQHGQALLQALQAAGVRASCQPFAGGHGIDPGLFPLMRRFLADAWEPPVH
ncbi:MAG: dienelactone hydrolase family protein [Cyanobacteriota bacterium]|nr:dienelactone hydrolase family protein [Cyanobacteriota bacterium]